MRNENLVENFASDFSFNPKPKKMPVDENKDVVIRDEYYELTNDKLELLYEYNEINKKVEALMRKRDELLKKESENRTVKKARELMKKKVEFHNYWIKKLYTILFYTHIILVVLVFILLIYKLL